MANDDHQTPPAHEPGSSETSPLSHTGDQSVNVDRDNREVSSHDEPVSPISPVSESGPSGGVIEPAAAEPSHSAKDKGKGIETATSQRDVVQDDPQGNEGLAPVLPPRPVVAHNTAASPAQPVHPQFVYEQPYNTTVLPTRHDLLHHLPPDSRRTTKTKLALSLLGACLGIGLLGLSGALLSVNTILYNYGHSFTDAAYAGFAIGAVALVWNAAEIVVYGFRVSRTDRFRGIHPGAHIALQLLLALGSGAGLALVVMTLVRVQSTVDWCARDNGRAHLFGPDYGNSVCDSVNPRIGPGLAKDYLEALLALYVVAIVVDFILFVWACVEVHVRVQVQEVYVLPYPPQAVMVPQPATAMVTAPGAQPAGLLSPSWVGVAPNEKGAQQSHEPQEDVRAPVTMSVEQEKVGVAL